MAAFVAPQNAEESTTATLMLENDGQQGAATLDQNVNTDSEAKAAPEVEAASTAATPKYLDEETVAKLHEIYKKVVIDHPCKVGKYLSAEERQRLDINSGTLTYGEIEFLPFAIAFGKIKNKYRGLRAPGGVFYDIGSGTGKPTIAATLLHEFDSANGIEILVDLHGASLEIQSKWEAVKAEEDVSELTRATAVEYTVGDFTLPDFSMADATMAFANSTCFSKKLMASLALKADAMAPGSFFITFTKQLPSNNWDVLERERYRMSWGQATVFIQRRNGNNPNLAAADAEQSEAGDAAAGAGTAAGGGGDAAAGYSGIAGDLSGL